MSLLGFQIFAIISIFLMALISGLLPFRYLQQHHTAFALGDAWASGIFLGAALFHMLPDAQKIFSNIFVTNHYPFASLFCLLGFLVLLIVERGVIEITNHNHQDYSQVTGIILLILLSIHSLIEGAAIGINVIFADVIPIYIAVMAHKGSASFALAINLHRTPLSKKIITVMIILFSLMTPLGIIFSSTLLHFTSDHGDQIMEATFNAFAAGSFLYIGMRHIMEEQFIEYKHANPVKEFFAIISGVALMAVVAIWT